MTVVTLSDVTSLGGGMDEQTASLTLAAQTIAITEYAVSDYDTVLTFRNNHNNPVVLDEIWIDNKQCLFFYGTIHRLNPGQSKNIACQNVYELDETSVEYPVVINWTDVSTGASFTQSNSDAVIITDVSNKYLNILQSNQYWNESINGCYDNTITYGIPICTCIDLNKTRDNLATNHTMQNSVDFIRCNKEFGVDFRGGEGWVPIQNGLGWPGAFDATFDGNYNLINNMRIFSGDTDVGNLGLFELGGTLNFEVLNLGLTNMDINATGLDSRESGGIVGRSTNALISNVFVMGNISVYKIAGGLIGSGGYDTVSNSYFIGNIYGVVGQGTYLGGIIGSSEAGTFNNLYTKGVLVTSMSSGGLTGYANGASISNSYSTMTFSNPGSNNASLVGDEDNGLALFENNYWLNDTNDGITNCVDVNVTYHDNGCTIVSSLDDIPLPR